MIIIMVYYMMCPYHSIIIISITLISIRHSPVIYGYGSIPINTIFSGGWTSINPSYFDVNYRGFHGFWHTAISWNGCFYSWQLISGPLEPGRTLFQPRRRRSKREERRHYVGRFSEKNVWICSCNIGMDLDTECVYIYNNYIYMCDIYIYVIYIYMYTHMWSHRNTHENIRQTGAIRGCNRIYLSSFNNPSWLMMIWVCTALCISLCIIIHELGVPIIIDDYFEGCFICCWQCSFYIIFQYISSRCFWNMSMSKESRHRSSKPLVSDSQSFPTETAILGRFLDYGFPHVSAVLNSPKSLKIAQGTL